MLVHPKSDVDGLAPVAEKLEIYLQQAMALPPVPAAVVHPVSETTILAAAEAQKYGLIEPILVGPEKKIREAAQQAGVDIDAMQLVTTEHSHAAAERAVELARERTAQMLIKGSLSTKELLKAILHKELGVRSERRLSHAFVLDVPSYDKVLIVTDAAINIEPTLLDKKDILQNAIDLSISLGVKEPKAAILSAVEYVNPAMKSTLDAAALCKMADRGQITGACVDGPLAFDNAISLEAAEEKGIKSPVAGNPDILLVPDIETGNVLAKQLLYLGQATAAGILLGARVPVVLTSRSETLRGRLYSCALARLRTV